MFSPKVPTPWSIPSYRLLFLLPDRDFQKPRALVGRMRMWTAGGRVGPAKATLQQGKGWWSPPAPPAPPAMQTK